MPKNCTSFDRVSECLYECDFVCIVKLTEVKKKQQKTVLSFLDFVVFSVSVYTHTRTAIYVLHCKPTILFFFAYGLTPVVFVIQNITGQWRQGDGCSGSEEVTGGNQLEGMKPM